MPRTRPADDLHSSHHGDPGPTHLYYEVTVKGTASIRLGTLKDGTDTPDGLWLSKFTELAKEKELFVSVKSVDVKEVYTKYSEIKVSTHEVLVHLYDIFEKQPRKNPRGVEAADLAKIVFGNETDTAPGRANAIMKINRHLRELSRAEILLHQRRGQRYVYFPRYRNFDAIPPEYRSFTDSTLRRR
jgi:hypothetical protein